MQAIPTGVSCLLHYQSIDLSRDRETILGFHCRIIYESESPLARTVPFHEYSERLRGTLQPDEFLAYLSKTLDDERTIAKLVLMNDTAVGYVWVVFHDIPDYSTVVAEVMDVIVSPGHRRGGIGRTIPQYVEDVARTVGATLLRSETGAENAAAQNLHRTCGSEPYRICYEKSLSHIGRLGE